MNEQYKYNLDESRLPKAWYNINADMPVPPAACVESTNAGTYHAGFLERAVPHEPYSARNEPRPLD